MRVALAPFLALEPGLFRLSLVSTLSLALGVLSVGSAHAVTFSNIGRSCRYAPPATNCFIGAAQLDLVCAPDGARRVR